LILAFGLFLSLYVRKKFSPIEEPPTLTSEEETFLDLVPVVESIQFYLANKNPAAKLEMVRQTRELVDSLDWDESPEEHFQLVKREIDAPINQFIDGLRNRLVPALRSDQTEVFEKAVAPLVALGHYLLNPTLQGLNAINAELETLPPLQEVRKPPRFKAVKQAAPYFIGGILSGTVVFAIGLQLGAAPSISYGYGVITFVAFIGGYFAKPYLSAH
jgi:hypothetical protein